MPKARVLLFLVVCLLLARPAFAQTETMRVKLWHSWRGADADLLKAWIEDFQTANPGTVIDARLIDGDLKAQFEAALRTESGPDMIIGPSSWVGSLAENKRIAPLDSQIDKTLRAQATEVSWQNLTVGNSVYGVPESNQGIALFYNSALAEPPTTFDELFAKPEQLVMSYDFYTSAGIYFGLGGHLLSDFGINLVNTDQSFSDYLTLLKQNYGAFRKASPATDRSNVISDDAFRQGNVAFLIDGNWKITDLRYYLGDKLKVALLPPIKSDKPWMPFVTTQAFYVSANAINPGGAWQFMRYTLGTAPQTKAAALAQHIPVNPEAKIDDPLMAVFAKQFESGSTVPTRTEMGVYWSALDDAVFAVTVRDAAVNDVTASTTAQIAAALSRLRNTGSATPTR